MERNIEPEWVKGKVTVLKQGERVLYISIDLSLAKLLKKLGLLENIEDVMVLCQAIRKGEENVV